MRFGLDNRICRDLILGSEIPLASMRLVLPSGEPRSRIDASSSFAHFIHPSYLPSPAPSSSRHQSPSTLRALRRSQVTATNSSSVFSLSKINPVLIIRRFHDRILSHRTIAALILIARLGIDNPENGNVGYGSLADVGRKSRCPLCPQKRTFASALSMSALCQERTSTITC